ncbi:hypothetical protein Ancab_029681 [Ancistrocladus abbreviatus]
MSFSDPASYNQGHQYAVILFNYGQASMQGGRATISQWDPHLAQPADFSLSQIWIMGGQSGTTNWQTIEAGWQKYPQRTGVNGPTFFVFWTMKFCHLVDHSVETFSRQHKQKEGEGFSSAKGQGGWHFQGGTAIYQNRHRT